MLETLTTATAVFDTLAPNVQTAMAMFVVSAAILGVAVGLLLSALWRWALD